MDLGSSQTVSLLLSFALSQNTKSSSIQREPSIQNRSLISTNLKRTRLCLLKKRSFRVVRFRSNQARLTSAAFIEWLHLSLQKSLQRTRSSRILRRWLVRHQELRKVDKDPKPDSKVDPRADPRVDHKVARMVLKLSSIQLHHTVGFSARINSPIRTSFMGKIR